MFDKAYSPPIQQMSAELVLSCDEILSFFIAEMKMHTGKEIVNKAAAPNMGYARFLVRVPRARVFSTKQLVFAANSLRAQIDCRLQIMQMFADVGKSGQASDLCDVFVDVEVPIDKAMKLMSGYREYFNNRPIEELS